MSSFKSDKDNGFDLDKYTDGKVRVKFNGGREVQGILKGFDKLDNLVLEECVEYLRDADNNVTENTRTLGQVVCRGPQVSLISPVDGLEEIANPFEEDGEGEEVDVKES
jgi:U6 snRNA-associated Sm-like protein LSm7